MRAPFLEQIAAGIGTLALFALWAAAYCLLCPPDAYAAPLIALT